MKAKFDNALMRHDLCRNEPEETMEQLIEARDEFAVIFSEWCDSNYFRMGNTSFWAESMDWDNNTKFTTKELLEIFKKENPTL